MRETFSYAFDDEFHGLPVTLVAYGHAPVQFPLPRGEELQTASDRLWRSSLCEASVDTFRQANQKQRGSATVMSQFEFPAGKIPVSILL